MYEMDSAAAKDALLELARPSLYLFGLLLQARRVTIIDPRAKSWISSALAESCCTAEYIFFRLRNADSSCP